MDKETFIRQKAFAGEKKPSMLRRCVDHDYTGRCMYMVTLVTEGRKPLLGRVTGRSDAPADSPEAPKLEMSTLGQRVYEEWLSIPAHHPEITLVALQMMPDHLHGILFVTKRMEQPLGMVLRGLKQSCNKHYRQLVLGVSYVALATQQTERATQQTERATQQTERATQQTERGAQQTERATPLKQKPDRRGEDRSHGMLFARGYNDKILLREGQLERWKEYLSDNPRRLLMKREHPDLFRIQRGLNVKGQSFSAIGNIFLLTRPLRLQVQCSRRLTDEQIAEQREELLEQARQGAVLVSPSISKGEKAIMRAAFEEGFPIIILQENGFADLAKPGGKRMEACAMGKLLLLAPWEHHNEQQTISRGQCLQLNDLAHMICE